MHIEYRLGLPLLLAIWSLAMAPGSVGAAEAETATASAAAGCWLTEPRDGIIEVSVDAAGHLEGRIVGGSHPGRLAAKNPDPAACTQVLRGRLILRGMAYEGKGRWSGGTIYDPDSGRTYKCNFELLPDGTLDLPDHRAIGSRALHL
jgi:uncharacterized protein (DUF2147 family)